MTPVGSAGHARTPVVTTDARPAVVVRDRISEHLTATAGAAGASAVDLCGRWFVAIVAATWAAGLLVGFERALTVLVALGFVGALAGLAYPALGLLSVAMLCALDTPARVYLLVGGLLRFNTLNYLLLGVSLLGLGFLRRLHDPHTRILQLFVVLLGIGLLLSPTLTFGAQHLLNVVALFGLLVYFAPAASGMVVWYWLGIGTGAVGAGGGLLYYLQRSTLPEINANAWTLFPLTALFAICLAAPFARAVGRGHLPLMLLAVVNAAWVFLSSSRGGLLTAVVCIAYLVVSVRGVGGRVSLLLLAGLAAVVVSTQFTDLQAHTLHRLDRLFNTEVSMVGRTSGRSELMRGGWAIFEAHPFGVGTGGFARAWSELSPTLGLAFRTGQQFQSHSAWIKVLAENGVPGILLFAAYVGSFAVVGVLSRQRDARLLGVLTTCVLAAAFGTTEFQAKGLWFLAAGATTLLHSARIAQLVPARGAA